MNYSLLNCWFRVSYLIWHEWSTILSASVASYLKQINRMSSLLCWHPTHDHFVVLNSRTRASRFTFSSGRTSRFYSTTLGHSRGGRDEWGLRLWCVELCLLQLYMYFVLDRLVRLAWLCSIAIFSFFILSFVLLSAWIWHDSIMTQSWKKQKNLKPI